MTATTEARSPEDVLHELVEAVIESNALAAQRAKVLHRRDALVEEAFKLGLYGTDISKVAGLSLGRAYQIRDKKKAS